MTFAQRNLSDLKKLENNPRTISGDQFKKLCESLEKSKDYFNARPLILSDRTGELVIIAGNQRYEAAKKIGMKTVPTYLLSGLDEEREKEIVIRDNVNNGDWDMEILANEFDVEDLEHWGMDEVPEVEVLDPEEKDDEVPEPPKDPKTKPGDLYELGGHRLL